MRLGFAFLAAVVGCAASDPVQCSGHPSTGCGVPNWDIRWDMAGSGYVYCFGGCPLEWLANHTSLGVFGGIVGVDHYWTKQGMPCINGIPQEFKMQDAFAVQTKTTFPRSKILEYRITDAVPYDAIVHDLMIECDNKKMHGSSRVSNPEYFVRWTHPPTNNGSICQMPYQEHGTENQNCSWPIIAAAYDFSQQVVQDWFLENIIKPTMKVADGVWLDGDGPDNGAWMCSGSYDWGHLPAPYPALNASEVDAFCTGEYNVAVAAHEWLASVGGFDGEVCWSFVSSASSYPSASDSASQCIAKLHALDHYAPNNGGGTVLMYGDRTGGNQIYNDETAAQAVATFLLVRGERFFFGLEASNSYNSSTAALLLSDYGVPLGNMTVSGDVATREYATATVSLDCDTFTATFTPK